MAEYWVIETMVLFVAVCGPTVPGYVKLLARDFNLERHFMTGENLSCFKDICTKVAHCKIGSKI